MRILLTGSSGFVGQAALGALLQRDVEVIAVSRRRPAVHGTYQWSAVNLLDQGDAANLVETVSPDTILHLAWTVEHGQFWHAAENLDWVAATLNLARAAANAGTQRFVGVGTCYEYDWPSNGDCRESGTPLKPKLLYGTAKDAVRRVLEEFGADNKLDVAWARLFFLYGPGEGPARLVPSVARALAAGEPANCSSGTSVRDYIDVRDAGGGLAALALSEVTGAVNVASGNGISIADMAQTLGRLASKPHLIKLGAIPDRPEEPSRIVADVTRLRDEVGYKPDRTLETGLADALEYWAHESRGTNTGKFRP